MNPVTKVCVQDFFGKLWQNIGLLDSADQIRRVGFGLKGEEALGIPNGQI